MSKSKTLTIDITYIDNYNKSKRSILLDIFSNITEDILEKRLINNKGKTQQTELYFGEYSYNLDYTNKVRVEKINGKKCYIYKSKMNLI